MGKAIAKTLTPEARATLEATVQSAVAPIREVRRARIVLLTAAGQTKREIAVQVDLSMNLVS